MDNNLYKCKQYKNKVQSAILFIKLNKPTLAFEKGRTKNYNTKYYKSLKEWEIFIVRYLLAYKNL